MKAILAFTLAFLDYSIASAFFLNLTSPVSSQLALNVSHALTLSAYLRQHNKVTNLTYKAECDGPLSGVDLTKEICQDAVAYGIPGVASEEVLEYGDRSTGSFDVNLPQRFISGNGRCIVELTALDIHRTAQYTQLGVALAAMYAIVECVQMHIPPQGGTILDFDQTNNLKVVVQTYKPEAVCVGRTKSSDVQRSCQSLLDRMLISELPLTFGYTSQSTVRMPYSRVSGDGLCVMEIDTSGVTSDTASWRDFWEVRVALNGMCIRKGREGFQIKIGAAGGLHMELKDRRNQVDTLSSS